MKEYKNKLFAVVMAVLAVVSFISCDDDYEWREATLDYYSTITAATNGTIKSDLPIDLNWIEVYGPYDHIDDIRFVGGYIEITPQGHIDWFRLTLSNSDAYLEVDDRFDGRLEGMQTQQFLNAVVEVVRRNGGATIYVDGHADRLVSFALDFYIDIDAHVNY